MRNPETKSTLRNSPLVNKLVAAAEAQAKAQARADMASELLASHAHGMKLDTASTLPESLVTKLKSEQVKAAETAKSAQKEVLQAAASLEIESLAKSAGAINPSLVALVPDTRGEVIKSVIDEETGNVTIKVTDKNGNPIYNPKTGRAITLPEYVSSMTTSDDASYLFDDGKTASLQGGSRIYNPFQKATFNLTKQGELLRSNPGLAAQMRAEVGVQ